MTVESVITQFVAFGTLIWTGYQQYLLNDCSRLKKQICADIELKKRFGL